MKILHSENSIWDVFEIYKKDFAWKLAKEAEEEGFEFDVNNVANIDAEEFLPQEASNSK